MRERSKSKIAEFPECHEPRPCDIEEPAMQFVPVNFGRKEKRPTALNRVAYPIEAKRDRCG